jgi:cobalt-precorrin 5A hydrolase
MRVAIVCFTKNGKNVSEKIVKALKDDVVEISARFEKEVQKDSLHNWTEKQFQKRHGIIFVGACGIAVRSIAPFVKDKLSDSPVVVVNEKGQYVISLISGHVGGANLLAKNIAEAIGAIPIITTATDINHKFAVDVFAVNNDLQIVNREGIAKISSMILNGKKIRIAIEGYIGESYDEKRIPEELCLVSYSPKVQTEIVISREQTRIFNAMLQLKPKEYVLGIGCKKGIGFKEIECFIKEQVAKIGISEKDLAVVASIDKKKEEEGIKVWKDYYRIPYITFNKGELKKVLGDFHSSEFVEKTVGVDNVCERAAMAACGNSGKLILEKQAKRGITIAIAKREWVIRWTENEE